MAAVNLVMSSTWTATLAEGGARRESGHPQTHMQCMPQRIPLSIPDDDRFLREYYDYYSTLPPARAFGAVPTTLNSIVEKVIPDKPFPFFVDLDFDAEWFGPSPSQLYEHMDVPFAFDLITETIELYRQLIASAFSLDDLPEYLVSMRAFYKCHLHFPDVFIMADMASALSKEACRIIGERHPEYSGNIAKAFDVKVYANGLRILGSHKGRIGSKADKLKHEQDCHNRYLGGHHYSQWYLIADIDAAGHTVTVHPLTLEALQRTSLHRQGAVLPVNPECRFIIESRNRNKRKFPNFSQRNATTSASVLPLETLPADAGIEDVARVVVAGALREAHMDPTVTRVRRYENTGFIEVTLSPRECPMKKEAHKRTQERNESANYVLVGMTHVFLRCWKCEGSIQLEDTPPRLEELMTGPAQKKQYKLFASLHDNTHELVSSVLFEAMKDTYAVAAVSDNRFVWYYFDSERHRWIQYEKVMTAIMEDKGTIQNMWANFVKALKREMRPPQDDADAGGKAEIYETILLRKLIRNLQNVGFIKNNIMAILARKIDWHWRSKTETCIPFAQRLDSLRHFIAYSNGVLNTQTREFGPGRPDQFVSKSTHIPYTPWESQPTELRVGLMGFLRQVQSVPDQLDYLLWVIASSFRGDAGIRQAFYFWIGMGANAKSTLIRMINQAMGDYACEVPVTLFTRERPSSEKPCPEVVATRGCRFASAPEPGLTDEFVMSTIKGFSGSDKITARRLNENMQSWYGSVTYHCSMNGFPIITSKDEDFGTWRRLNVILFESKFVSNPSGPREFKKMESAEFEANLQAWAVPFASLLFDYMIKRDDVPMPPAFVKATNDLKLKNDIIGKFVAHSVAREDGTFCEVMEAFSAFNTFKRMANVKGRPVSEEQFILYMNSNVSPLRTRMNNNKEENGWEIVIRQCGDRGYGSF